MRSLAFLPAVLMAAAILPAQTSPAQASRVVCVVNDTGFITRARAEHGANYAQHGSWDNMAASQRACFSGVAGALRLRIERWDFGWHFLCSREVAANDSRLVSIKVRGLTAYCD